MAKPIIVLDLETTGLDPARDAIIEIGAIKFKGDRNEGEFASLINPGRKLTPFITQLTGITDAMLVNAPRLAEVLPRLEDKRGRASSGQRASRTSSTFNGWCGAGRRRRGRRSTICTSRSPGRSCRAACAGKWLRGRSTRA